VTTPPASLLSVPPSSAATASAATASAASASAANTYTDLNGLAALKNAAGSPEAIRAVSQQVEALFLQMMLKSMREASDAAGELTSNETSMYQDMFDKQVALTLSKHQDLGIARLFERQLGGQAAPGAPAAGSPAMSASPGSAPPASKPGPAMPRADADGRSAAPSASATTAQHAAQFVGQVLPAIQRAARMLGINPLGLLAQAALETGWGQRMARTADGSPSLNLFGVKAGEEWNGARAVAETVEFNGGLATQRRTAFRAYGSIEQSVSDFASLLSTSPRYREAVAAGSNIQAYIDGIARSGYATDPAYGIKLNEILNGSTLRAALHVRTAAL
jgi:flagellar protein FlgJ